jgi:hypothetical protein
VYTNGSNEYAASIFRAVVVEVKIQFDLCCSHIFCSHLLLALPDRISSAFSLLPI